MSGGKKPYSVQNVVQPLARSKPLLRKTSAESLQKLDGSLHDTTVRLAVERMARSTGLCQPNSDYQHATVLSQIEPPAESACAQSCVPAVKKFTRIAVDADRMGGVPCIRGLRIPVATVVGMVSEEMIEAENLKAYPNLEREDLREALHYAAEAVRERELSVRQQR